MDEFIFGQNLENQLKEISVISKLTTKKQQNGQPVYFSDQLSDSGRFFRQKQGPESPTTSEKSISAER